MPALAFGLNAPKSQSSIVKSSPQKRKAVFDEDIQAEEDDNDKFIGLQKPKPKPSKHKPFRSDDLEPLRKSPKLSSTIGQPVERSTKYTNLSALRSAKLQDEEAAKVDSSVYDYDAVYDSIHAPTTKKKIDDQSSGPKYMGSLLQSAEVRKQDQLRAREKLLQKERDAEGDEFADKEKFVTGAYKKQQEELRLKAEEEDKRAAEEEEKRRKGGGMTDFNKSLLRREEERQLEIQKATEEAQRRNEAGEAANTVEAATEMDENKMAAQLNQKGGHIVINDEGEVVDKRQLLGAGLNVAPKNPGVTVQTKKNLQAERPQTWRRSEQARNTRHDQRERQTSMIERQIEEMAEKQRQAEEAEQKEIEEKNKSKMTDETKMSAKERYLQRKKEREEQAKKAG